MVAVVAVVAVERKVVSAEAVGDVVIPAVLSAAVEM